MEEYKVNKEELIRQILMEMTERFVDATSKTLPYVVKEDEFTAPQMFLDQSEEVLDAGIDILLMFVKHPIHCDALLQDIADDMMKTMRMRDNARKQIEGGNCKTVT